jgi:ATP:corrinoid adenosyltransferase
MRTASTIGLRPTDASEYLEARMQYRTPFLIGDLVLTGNHAHLDIIAMADLVTEMREVKHPY